MNNFQKMLQQFSFFFSNEKWVLMLRVHFAVPNTHKESMWDVWKIGHLKLIDSNTLKRHKSIVKLIRNILRWIKNIEWKNSGNKRIENSEKKKDIVKVLSSEI